MNWGWKIVGLYVGFISMMLTLVFLCTQQDILLVTENYYEKDLTYDTHIKRLQNSQLLEKNVAVAYNSNQQQLSLQFPNQFDEIKGKVLFYRPSKADQDFSLPIEVNADKQLIINTNKMIKGYWRVKIKWAGNGQLFYKEAVLKI